MRRSRKPVVTAWAQPRDHVDDVLVLGYENVVDRRRHEWNETTGVRRYAGIDDRPGGGE